MADRYFVTGRIPGEELEEGQVSTCDDCRALPPDPDGMNDDRAMWAGAAIEEFQRQTSTDDCDALSDLLCDLMHLCDRRDSGEHSGFNFEDQLERARRNYAEETATEGDEDVSA